jgi:hypothetical protein
MTEQEIEILKLASCNPKSKDYKLAMVKLRQIKFYQTILDLIQDGFLEWQDGWIKLTPTGKECLPQ